jgi:thiol-disulfide isomerase/thioredoxin
MNKILKFSANWCTSCKAVEKLIAHRTDIESIDVDTAEGDNLTEKYNIKSLPTILVLDDSDNEIERSVGTAEILKKYGYGD